MSRLVLGTRGSALALWQARHVAARLRSTHPGVELEERIIKTAGDRRRAPIDELGGRGVFVREVEEALLDRRIDLAVHSMKDLPTTQPEGLVISAVPERHDPRDALLSTAGWSIEDLPQGVAVATGSPRRRCQLLHARPDLKIVPVRGNVDTRVTKLQQGQFDALVLALAGVERLGITSVSYRPIAPEVCLPAVGQGALAVETRADDERVRDIVQTIDAPRAASVVSAERAFLRRLGGGCLAPATAYARIENGRLRLRAVVGDPDGRRLIRQENEGTVAEGDALGEALAEQMLADGADRLLEIARDAAKGHAAS